MTDHLFALPVEVRRCRRNPKRLVVVSATGEVLLRTLDDTMRDQDVAERFARAMNEWAAPRPMDARRLEPLRFGLSRLIDEDPAPRRDRRPPFRLMACDRALGAWECCGFVHIPEVKTCPECGAPKKS